MCVYSVGFDPRLPPIDEAFKDYPGYENLRVGELDVIRGHAIGYNATLPSNFYGDYEWMPPVEPPKFPQDIRPRRDPQKPTTEKPSKPPPRITEPLFDAELDPDHEKGSSSAYEDPDDPWLMQQQAFAELATCYQSAPVPWTHNISANIGKQTSPTKENKTLLEVKQGSSTDGILVVGMDGIGSARSGNQTAGSAKPNATAGRPTIVPGTLLRCVQRVVQMRCHVAAHSSNRIGRQACEVMCDAVRQRMSRLIEFLHDCRQPLDSCTQRHSIFYVDREKLAADKGVTSQQPTMLSGNYCPICGNP